MKVACQFCGGELDTTPSRLRVGRGKYCSKQCRDADPRHIELMKSVITTKFALGLTPWNKGLSSETDLRVADVAVKVGKWSNLQWEINRDHILQRQAEGKANSLNYPWNRGLKGWLPKEKHPRWRGGIAHPNYGPNWDEQRELALERDDHHCQYPGCGAATSLSGWKLDVHHIQPFRLFGLQRYEEANRLDNLITYCHKHHMEMEWS